MRSICRAVVRQRAASRPHPAPALVSRSEFDCHVGWSIGCSRRRRRSPWRTNPTLTKGDRHGCNSIDSTKRQDARLGEREPERHGGRKTDAVREVLVHAARIQLRLEGSTALVHH